MEKKNVNEEKKKTEDELEKYMRVNKVKKIFYLSWNGQITEVQLRCGNGIRCGRDVNDFLG